MHARRRTISYLPSHRHGMRSSSHRYRSYGCAGRSRDHRRSFTPSQPPLPPSRAEILIEAGRLAVEYLVFKGLLPSSLLDGKLPNGKLQESKRCNREPLALERGDPVSFSHGNTGRNVGHRRRRYDEDDDYTDPRSERRRMSYYSLGYRSEWDRESRGDGRLRERSRGYDDSVEDEDSFTSWYHSHKKERADVSGNSVSKTTGNEWQCGSEVSGNLLMEVENHGNTHDTGSKKSSMSTRKNPKLEGDLDLNAQVDDSKMLKAGAGYEVKNEGDGYLDTMNFQEEDLHSQDIAIQGGKTSGDDFDLLKLCYFAKVPTKLRSSIAKRRMKVEQGPATKILGVSQENLEEKLLETSSSDSLLVGTKSLDSDAHDIPDVLPGTSEKVSLDLQEPCQNWLGYETSRLKLGLLEVHSSAESANKKEETMRDRNPFFEAEDPHEPKFRANCSSSSTYESRPSLNGEMIAIVGQGRVTIEPFSTSIGKKHDNKLGEEKQILPASFNTYDLNFMKSSETIEVPDDPITDNLPRPAPILKNEKELSASCVFSGDNKSNETSCFSWVSRDGKIVPVIDLENDCPIGASGIDDSMHELLGDVPIGLVEFWDQPPKITGNLSDVLVTKRRHT